jgi:NAD+ kinase
MISTVGLVLHPERDCTGAMETIVNWARSRAATVLGLVGEADRIDDLAVEVEAPQLAERSDLVVSLGGDGTMLRAMRMVRGCRAPVLGVNVGRLGFLAEIDVPELAGALTAIDEHRFTVEARAGVRAAFDGQDTTAFNDIALARIPGRGTSAAVELRVEGHRFVRYAADAVVVATPTGSTAYSFSAGGPIVSPKVEGLLVGPSAAHSSFNRPLFMSPDEELVLDVLRTSGRLAVEVDGIVEAQVKAGHHLRIEPVPDAARVVRLGRTTFYERARRKLQVSGSAQVGEADPAEAVVVDDVERSRYEVRLGGEVAGTLDYRRDGDVVHLLHTEIDQVYEGQGLGGRLAGGALRAIRARDDRVVVTCPYVTGYLQRHPEHADLLAEPIRHQGD